MATANYSKDALHVIGQAANANRWSDMNTYQVEIEKDSHDDRIKWLKVSHNGGKAWSLIEIRSSLEAEKIINALQQSFAVDETATCPSCEKGLCPDGKGGFIPCTICGREAGQVESLSRH